MAVFAEKRCRHKCKVASVEDVGVVACGKDEIPEGQSDCNQVVSNLGEVIGETYYKS